MLLLQHMHPLKKIIPMGWNNAARTVACGKRNDHCPDHLYALPMLCDGAASRKGYIAMLMSSYLLLG